MQNTTNLSYNCNVIRLHKLRVASNCLNKIIGFFLGTQSHWKIEVLNLLILSLDLININLSKILPTKQPFMTHKFKNFNVATPQQTDPRREVGGDMQQFYSNHNVAGRFYSEIICIILIWIDGCKWWLQLLECDWAMIMKIRNSVALMADQHDNLETKPQFSIYNI